jgi:hypothetical protein
VHGSSHGASILKGFRLCRRIPELAECKQPRHTLIISVHNPEMQSRCLPYALSALPHKNSTECVCVFRMVLTINSDCFPKQH